jgi:hypothetical protein
MEPSVIKFAEAPAQPDNITIHGCSLRVQYTVDIKPCSKKYETWGVLKYIRTM